MYLRNNNMTKKNMIDAYNRILTQKQYTRTSQNPLNSEKSMSIRKGMRDLASWTDNIGSAKELFLTAETSLTQVGSTLYRDVYTKLVQGSTSTVGEVGMMSVGTQLRQDAEEMVDAMNADFNERQMFGGASQNKTPFTIENLYGTQEDGVTPDLDNITDERVCYNGIDMQTIYKNSTDGLFYGTKIGENGEKTEDVLVPGQQSVLLDIGLGIEFDADLNVNKNTAFDTALHGFKILGYGEDDEGYPTNIIQLTLDASKIASTGDINRIGDLGKYIDKTADASANITTAITEIGVKYTSLDYYKSKNDDSLMSLRERQNTVEGTDIYEDITSYYAIQSAYDASLQMGGNILPKSIFDFI
jgi:flagellin-like hook-associated protein FlgL